MAINGFPTCNPSVLGIYRVPGTNRSLQVRRDVAPLLIGFAAEFHRLVEPINGRLDDWGYACRNVRGHSTPSFHSAGLAIDLNATRHQLGHSGTFSAKQRSIIRALCRKYGLRWGGDYRGRKDEMHFEVIKPRGTAVAMAMRLQVSPTKKKHPLQKVIKKRVVGLRGPFPLHSGAFGPAPKDYNGHENTAARNAVVQIQRALNYTLHLKLALDGAYGSRTVNAVKVFQRKHKLPVTGRVDKRTWTELDRRTP